MVCALYSVSHGGWRVMCVVSCVMRGVACVCCVVCHVCGRLRIMHGVLRGVRCLMYYMGCTLCCVREWLCV